MTIKRYYLSDVLSILVNAKSALESNGKEIKKASIREMSEFIDEVKEVERDVFLAKTVCMMEIAKIALTKLDTTFKEETLAQIENLITEIEKSENNICADCEHAKYIRIWSSPDETECTCSESEHYKDELPLFYGTETCECFKKLIKKLEEYDYAE